MSGARSSRKGGRGEPELVEVLRRHGFRAWRSSRMYQRGDVAPDVSSPELPLHVEVKRVEALRIGAALDQARGKVPVVAWRSNRRPWVAILPLDELLELLRPNM